MWTRFTVRNETRIASAIMGLRHAALTEQGHLDALALYLSDVLPPPRVFEFPNLLRSAFDDPRIDGQAEPRRWLQRSKETPMGGRFSQLRN